MAGSRAYRRGFTLVEILIVVVILGILAAVVVPQFTGATEDSRRGAFVTEIKVWMDAMELFRVREGQWVSDGSSGVCPDEFRPYIDDDDFESGTPIGGVWDIEFNESGVTQAVGVHFFNVEPQDDEYMAIVDAILDDGDLEAGLFQKFAADRFYAVVAD